MGPLTGGPQCRMSILENGNVPGRYFCNFHVHFTIGKCRIRGKAHVMSVIFMSHVDNAKLNMSILKEIHVSPLSILRIKGPQ